jgi:hypothetical protein
MSRAERDQRGSYRQYGVFGRKRGRRGKATFFYPKV